MRLSRQLVLLIVGLMLLLFIGTALISLLNTRDYLQNQLASHAQDAATSLGLSATAKSSELNRGALDALVSAMFHRGDYQSVRVEDPQQRLLLERVAPPRESGVPQWFINYFPLDPPLGQAEIMAGWQSYGQVLVTSHPGLAYRKLWLSARDTLLWFLLVALVVFIGGVLTLRWLLRPLRHLEEQAEAICQREFPRIAALPFTYEFRRLQEAMNKLSERVSGMLDKSERLANRLRAQAYLDGVTGLANRQRFMDILSDRSGDTHFVHGALMLIELHGFKAYNQQKGFKAGDDLLRRVADVLREQTADQPHITVAHTSGSNFALLLEGVEDADSQRLAKQLLEVLSGLFAEFELPDPNVAHLGVALYRGQSVADWLAEADEALRAAQREGPNAWVLKRAEGEREEVRGLTAWRELLKQVIDQRQVTLLRQPVVATADKQLLHEEVFLRIADLQLAGEWIPAGRFMPMAEASGMAREVDRLVLDLLLTDKALLMRPARQAVNMSVTSLQTDELLDWLEAQLRMLDLGEHLILEWSEYGALAHTEALMRWMQRLRPLGVQFSLDHFGKGFSAFAYLQQLPVDYLKVDGSYLQGLEAAPNNQLFLQVLSEIAHGLEIKLIAEAVESEASWQQLPALGVDGGRGYWLGRPE